MSHNLTASLFFLCIRVLALSKTSPTLFLTLLSPKCQIKLFQIFILLLFRWQFRYVSIQPFQPLVYGNISAEPLTHRLLLSFTLQMTIQLLLSLIRRRRCCNFCLLNWHFNSFQCSHFDCHLRPLQLSGLHNWTRTKGTSLTFVTHTNSTKCVSTAFSTTNQHLSPTLPLVFQLLSAWTPSESSFHFLLTFISTKNLHFNWNFNFIQCSVFVIQLPLQLQPQLFRCFSYFCLTTNFQLWAHNFPQKIVSGFSSHMYFFFLFLCVWLAIISQMLPVSSNCCLQPLLKAPLLACCIAMHSVCIRTCTVRAGGGPQHMVLIKTTRTTSQRTKALVVLTLHETTWLYLSYW